MKKSHLTLAAILLCTLYGVLSWDIVTHSEAPGPETSANAEFCKTTTTPGNAAQKTEYDLCCIDYREALDAIKRDWLANLKQLTSQEIAASKMVDDGYESLRTYNCWAEYICLAVQYSGHAPAESSIGTGLTYEHLGVVPGCQAPDVMRMGSEYNNLIENMKDIPVAGVPAGATADWVVKTFEDIQTENKINFFPRCMSDPKDNQHPNLTYAKNQYDDCKNVLETYFGCSKDKSMEKCEETSTAFVTLENELKFRQGDQKAAALEKKLGTIVPKIQTMEGHVEELSRFLNQLDARFSCYAGECS